MESAGLRVLAIDYGDVVIMQGLELDVAAQGASEDQARERFDTALRVELLECAKNDSDPNEVIGKAPTHFFDSWDSCSPDESKTDDYELRRCAA